jgi:hypothetical protein
LYFKICLAAVQQPILPTVSLLTALLEFLSYVGTLTTVQLTMTGLRLPYGLVDTVFDDTVAQALHRVLINVRCELFSLNSFVVGIYLCIVPLLDFERKHYLVMCTVSKKLRAQSVSIVVTL